MSPLATLKQMVTVSEMACFIFIGLSVSRLTRETLNSAQKEAVIPYDCWPPQRYVRGLAEWPSNEEDSKGWRSHLPIFSLLYDPGGSVSFVTTLVSHHWPCQHAWLSPQVYHSWPEPDWTHFPAWQFASTATSTMKTQTDIITPVFVQGPLRTSGLNCGLDRERGKRLRAVEADIAVLSIMNRECKLQISQNLFTAGAIKYLRAASELCWYGKHWAIWMWCWQHWTNFLGWA
jgi:hypothetical protein